MQVNRCLDSSRELNRYPRHKLLKQLWQGWGICPIRKTKRHLLRQPKVYMQTLRWTNFWIDQISEYSLMNVMFHRQTGSVMRGQYVNVVQYFFWHFCLICIVARSNTKNVHLIVCECVTQSNKIKVAIRSSRPSFTVIGNEVTINNEIWWTVVLYLSLSSFVLTFPPI